MIARLRRRFSVRGRGTRLEFSIRFGMAALAIALYLQERLWPRGSDLSALCAYMLMILIPVALIAAIRRMHDLECPVGLYTTIAGSALCASYLVSLWRGDIATVLAGGVGVITLAWLALWPGTRWPNIYGAEPGRMAGALPQLPVISLLGPNEWSQHESFVVGEDIDKVLRAIGEAAILPASLLMIDATGCSFTGSIRREGWAVTYVIEPGPSILFEDLRERMIRDFERKIDLSLREYGKTRWSAANVGLGKTYLSAAQDVPGILQALDRWVTRA